MNKSNRTFSMGLPSILEDRDTVFPRTHRFLFIPAKNPDNQYLVKKVSIDYFKKSFELHMIEAIPAFSPSVSVQDVVLTPVVDDFKLIALTGCGEEIYTFDFREAKIVSHKVDYDYELSDPVTHQIGFEFKEMVRSMP